MALIGEMRLFGSNYAPRGWRECNGALLKIQDHMALYAILGTTNGGDGQTRFALPRIAPLEDQQGSGSAMYIICVDGDFPRRG